MDTEILVYRVLVRTGILDLLASHIGFYHPSGTQPAKEAYSLGCCRVRWTWLFVCRLGGVLARTEHNYPSDDVYWAGCFRYRRILPHALILPFGSMSESACYQQFADLNQTIPGIPRTGFRRIDYWMELLTLTWITPGSLGNHFSATSIEVWASTTPFGGAGPGCRPHHLLISSGPMRIPFPAIVVPLVVLLLDRKSVV